MAQGLAAGCGVGEAHVVEGDEGLARGLCRGDLDGVLLAICEGGLDGEDLVDAVRAGLGLGDGGDEPGELEELDEGLADVARQGHDLALREVADVHLQAADPQKRDEAEVHDAVGEGVHEHAEVAGLELKVAHGARDLVEAGDLGVLLAEGAQHAGAGEVLGGLELDVVEGVLGLAVALGRDPHKEEDEPNGHDGRRGEDRAFPAVDEQRRDHGADDDEGRAQDQAEKEVQAVLHLLGVVGDARDERGAAEPVDVLAREREDVAEEVVAAGDAELRGELRREVLRDDGDDVTEHGEQHEGAGVQKDEGFIAVGDAHVDDLRHHEGDDELEDGLQPLERGREHALEVVPAQVTPQLEHTAPTCTR